MSRLLMIAVALAAGLFVVLSATMNALFLSSLGRTPLEIGVLGLVSIAADIAKAALPVVILRAIALRAWVHLGCASVMLVLVVALSLASGTGFAALTRGSATATRQAKADEISHGLRTAKELDAQLQHVPDSRSVAVIEAELAATKIDWRWNASNACLKIGGSSTRQFCASVSKLQVELAAARERQRLSTERNQLNDRISTLRAVGGSTESDPQAAALAELFGVDAAIPRLVLTTFMALVIELGSVILIVLVSGPTLLGWRDPQEPVKQNKQVTLPTSKDVNHWRRRQEDISLSNGRSGGHDR